MRKRERKERRMGTSDVFNLTREIISQSAMSGPSLTDFKREEDVT